MTQPKLDLQALLTHLPLFRNLAPEQLTLMAGAAREARVQKNAYLLVQPRESSLLHLDLNKNLIASKLGLTPETFSPLLGQLGHDGLIAVAGPEIRLLDPEGLERRLFTS